MQGGSGVLVLDIGKKYPAITGPLSDIFADDLVNASVNVSHTLVLDFKGTKTINSMAMGAIFSTYQKLNDEGKALQIINASPRVKQLMRMVNLGNLLAGESLPHTHSNAETINRQNAEVPGDNPSSMLKLP